MNVKQYSKTKCVAPQTIYQRNIFSCTLSHLRILRHKISFDSAECLNDIFICLDVSISQFENEGKLLQL